MRIFNICPPNFWLKHLERRENVDTWWTKRSTRSIELLVEKKQNPRTMMMMRIIIKKKRGIYVLSYTIFGV
jgi:hypothetical protein